MANKCTLKDVAKACGVSAYTVSRAMNNKPDISEATKNSILEKARAMGYVVNRGAKNLKSGKSDVVAIVYDDFKNPFYNQLIEMLSTQLYRNGYNITMFYDFESISMLNTHFLKRILASDIDGIISLIPVSKNAVSFNENWEKPIVQIGSPAQSLGIDVIYSDDYSGGKELTELLIKKGHRRIGFINAAPNMIPGLRRIQGYLAAIKEKGFDYADQYVLHLNGQLFTLEDALRRLVKDGCDAIICFNDLTALSGKRILQEWGEDEVEFAGFDGIERYTPIGTHLVSAHLEVEKIAEEAANILLKRLKGEDFPFVDKIFPITVKE